MRPCTPSRCGGVCEPMSCDAAGTVAAIRAVAATVAEHKVELTHLDREIGDGDHGENLSRGFTAVLTKLDAGDPNNPGAVLKLVATTLISTVGGAAGPLFGTAFLRAATSVGDADTLDGAAVAAALTAARRSEEHTSELQSRLHLVCRLLLEKKT